MRRLAVTAVIALAAAGIATAASGAPLFAKSKAVVRLKSCSIDDHDAVFYGRMRRLEGTRRMRMKFTLLERVDGALRFRPVRAQGLRRWRKSGVGVRAYGYRQAVRGLRDGSAYRMRVSYRWYDRNNRLQLASRRTSPTCRMFIPDLNLSVRIVGVRVGNPWRYGASVINAGKVGVDGAAVRLRVDGGVIDTKTVPRLEPGAAETVVFDGPACKTRYSFLVDPDGQIPEANETDNRAANWCLGPG
jgi:CARDB